jgi:hypothetical protein
MSPPPKEGFRRQATGAFWYHNIEKFPSITKGIPVFIVLLPAIMLVFDSVITFSHYFVIHFKRIVILLHV